MGGWVGGWVGRKWEGGEEEVMFRDEGGGGELVLDNPHCCCVFSCQATSRTCLI